MREKRNAWTKNMSECDIKNLVFLDESGVNTNMTRLYARALGGERAVDSAPVNTPTGTTILSSIRVKGATAYTTVLTHIYLAQLFFCFMPFHDILKETAVIHYGKT